jgi:IrrE N-terminal-like domain
MAPLATRDLIDGLVRSMGAPDPDTAIRMKARDAIERFRATFGDLTMPLDVDALASFLGIGRSEDPPTHSEDAELVPVGDGRVAIRVSLDRPETRRRFSIAHEISHTFFADHGSKTWCRTDAHFRRRDNPDDLLEMLCDISASELVLPGPWFMQDATNVSTGAGLIDLSQKYIASREATLRRFAESHSAPVAALFLSWKLKPTQQSTVGNLDQQNLFNTDLADNARNAKRLRLDYSVLSPSFSAAGHYLPADKSVKNDGPLYEAAATGKPCEGECHLDLGPAAGRYRVLAVPVWTDNADLGPAGENALAAIIEPLAVMPSRKQRQQSARMLFD